MNFNQSNLKYIRKLIIALTASGILNIILIAAFFYWLTKDTPPSPYFEQKPALTAERQPSLAIESGNAELIHYFRSLTFDQLKATLSNTQLVENGYLMRDIALGALVAFHHFDLSRALVGYPFPDQRSIVYGQLKSGKPATIIVYPGLSDHQFEAVINFANTERWPLTSKGLFLQLKKQGNDKDPSLLDAFLMTPEFLAVEMLFNRADMPINKVEIQQMVLEGAWPMLSDFSEQQKHFQDLSPAKRQRFLLDYIGHHSKTAAYLLLKTDGEFALKKLDDQHVIDLLELMNDKTAESEKFARDLLISPRSTKVWKLASAKLYQYAGEKEPEANLHHMAIKRFGIESPLAHSILEKPIPKIDSKPIADKKTPEKRAEKMPLQTRKERLYIVQEGDSLWKIAKRFNVNIDALRNHNKLTSDALKPGSPIRIP